MFYEWEEFGSFLRRTRLANVGKEKKEVSRRGGQDEKINSVYRERADVDGGESGRI